MRCALVRGRRDVPAHRGAVVTKGAYIVSPSLCGTRSPPPPGASGAPQYSALSLVSSDGGARHASQGLGKVSKVL